MKKKLNLLIILSLFILLLFPKSLNADYKSEKTVYTDRKEEKVIKIFDPFFTTNRNNGGSGLGLNIIYNIITSRLNGSIKCISEVNQGIEFTIILKV